MASEFRGKGGHLAAPAGTGKPGKAAKLATKAAQLGELAERLDRLAEHLDSVDTWTRTAGRTRRPRLSREAIAAVALRLADAEGLDALSMRRLAAELDVGTMSLYHYVRTKDELLTLVLDALLGEVLLPPGARLPRQWRDAITVVALRTRDALVRHQWVLDIADDPPIGPNAIRHFDQTLRALESLDADLETKLDLMTAVDEYVFGHCLHARNHLADDTATSAPMLDYVNELIDGGGLPTLAAMVDEGGAEPLWRRIHRHLREPDRFERNLARLLDGFAAGLAR